MSDEVHLLGQLGHPYPFMVPLGAELETTDLRDGTKCRWIVVAQNEATLTVRRVEDQNVEKAR